MTSAVEADDAFGGEDPDIDPASLMLDAVVRLMRATYQIGSVRLRPWKVTLSSYAALRVIADQPDLTLAQLARRNFVRPQTMTRIATELERRGWIVRQPHPNDDRALALTLTPLGRETLSEMSAEVDQIETTVKAILKPQQIVQVDSLLRACAREIESEIGELSPRDAI